MALRKLVNVAIGTMIAIVLNTFTSFASQDSLADGDDGIVAGSFSLVEQYYAEALAEFQLTPTKAFDVWYIPVNRSVRVLLLSASSDKWLIEARNFATDVAHTTSISVARTSRDLDSPLFNLYIGKGVTTMEKTVVSSTTEISQADFSAISTEMNSELIRSSSKNGQGAEGVYPNYCSDGLAYFIETLFDRETKTIVRTSCDSEFRELSKTFESIFEVAVKNLPELAGELAVLRAEYIGSDNGNN